MRGIAIAIGLLVSGASTAGADPIRITAGDINVYEDGLDSFNLAGLNFTAMGSGIGAPFITTVSRGGTIDLSRSISVVPGAFDHGVVTTGGASLTGLAGGTFSVMATPFAVPAPGQIRVPFRLDGVVQLFPGVGSPAIFSAQVEGSGVMAFDVRDIGDDTLMNASPLSLEFSDPAATTPEPASILLLATGGFGLWRYRRRVA